MLTRLLIENFALIEHAEIEFDRGLNIITGETGAGKSILLGALNCILGGTARSDLIRGGCDRCAVEGLFEFDETGTGRQALKRLRQMGVEVTGQQLALRREIRESTRSRAFVDGRIVPLKRLQEIGGALIDLHGQHEHQSLLDEDRHVRFLDTCAQLGEFAAAVRASFHEVERCAEELANLERERAALLREEELRVFQLEEIRRIGPEEGEDELLETEVKVLANQAELSSEVGSVFDRLYRNDGAIVEVLGGCRRQLDRLIEIDPRLGQLVEEVEQLLFRAEDVAAGFREYLDRLEPDPERLEQARERLFELVRLTRKYGGTLADVARTARELEVAGDRLEEMESAIAAAGCRYAEIVESFARDCRVLSGRREKAASVLAGEVEKGLGALGIHDASFKARCTREQDPKGLVEIDGVRCRADATGVEKVVFFISTNPGEPPRPLARVASGGEISRIMLVLKGIISERDVVSTLVFDEIDSGVSGRIASAVGQQLKHLAHSHQAIAITHLPQIASLADCHFSVRKVQRRGRTVTEVHRLSDASERRDEVARLLAGESVSETARQHAEELLG